MKKLIYLIVLALILGLVLTGCSLLSNISQVPATGQSGITYLTKSIGPFLDLVGLWHFDEGVGTIASDSSVYGNHGTITGGATYAGIANAMFGDALSFNGIDGYVTVPDSASLDITGNITVEGWIKMTSFSQQATVAGKWKDISGTNQRGYMLAVHTDGTPRFYVSTDGINYPAAVGPALSLGSWYHLAGTWDGTNIKVYVDATTVSTGQTVSIFSNDQPLLIGANDGFGGSSRKFTNGIVDEVRVWSSVLAASQLDDMLPPKIIITTPTEGDTYLLNQVANTSWSVVDDDTGSGPGSGVTGVASESETVPINTSTVGEKTFEVTAEDYAMNTDTNAVNYVVYGFSGILPPIKPDGTRVFKLGSTIPVKFQLWDADGNFITDAEAEAIISLKKIIGEGPLGVPQDGDSTSAATSGNLFRYDDTDNQYIFNLATKGLSTGTWEITITVNGSASFSVNIGLK